MQIIALLLATVLTSLAEASDPPEVLYAYNFTESDRKFTLDLHNHARKCSDPPGTNQVIMTYDNLLESQATNSSRTCIMEHSWDAYGENIALNGPWEASTDPAVWQKYIKIMFDMWMSERNDMDYDANTCSKVCGHYTAIVNAMNHKVGCGMSLCSKITTDSGKEYGKGTLLFCRFDYIWKAEYGGNGFNRPYRNGTRCSGCRDTDTCIEGMCADRDRDGDVDYDSLATGSCDAPADDASEDDDEQIDTAIFADDGAEEEEVQSDAGVSEEAANDDESDDILEVGGTAGTEAYDVTTEATSEEPTTVEDDDVTIAFQLQFEDPVEEAGEETEEDSSMMPLNYVFSLLLLCNFAAVLVIT